MCKCENVQMLNKCANVRMCKCANGRISLLKFNNIRLFAYSLIIYTLNNHLHICTFSHLHIPYAFAHSLSICTFPKHLHIKQLFAHLHILTFAHSHICTFPTHLHIPYTFAHSLGYGSRYRRNDNKYCLVSSI